MVGDHRCAGGTGGHVHAGFLRERDDGSFAFDAEVRDGEKRLEDQSCTLDVFACAFEAVDGGDDGKGFKPGAAQDTDGLKRLPCGGRYVFNKDHAFSWLMSAFELPGGAVVLLGVANEQARNAGLDRSDRDERDSPELSPGKAVGTPIEGMLDGSDSLSQQNGKLGKNGRTGGEGVLIKVVGADFSGPEREFSSKQGGLGDGGSQGGTIGRRRGVVHSPRV